MTYSEIVQFYVRLTIMTYKVSLSKTDIQASKTDDQTDKVIIQPGFGLLRLPTVYNTVLHTEYTS